MSNNEFGNIERAFGDAQDIPLKGDADDEEVPDLRLALLIA